MAKNRREIIMNRIAKLPKGTPSPSGRYWCATCKKYFVLDKPVCPYMTAMCVNTPIPIEVQPPESTAFFEKIGLYYPKIPQEIMAAMVKKTDNLKEIGEKWASEYLSFLDDWHVNYDGNQVETVKSFILIISGSETAQRISSEKYNFIIMDANKVWPDTSILFEILSSALNVLRSKLKITQEIKLEEISIFGEREIGKYYCPMCKMFFEFGLKQDKVTCPLMPQKCMFTPKEISEMQYSINELIKIYRITPNIYSKLIKILEHKEDGVEKLKVLLKEKWNFTYTSEDLKQLTELLGLT